MNKTCSDCHGEMVEGFIVDIGDVGRTVPQWVKGKPEVSLWSGLKVQDKERRTVETYRCLSCGLLKSYARVKV